MEIYQYFNEDIELTTQAQIRLIDGEVLSNQRILRRLLTAPGTYIWHPTYGAGLPEYVGLNLSVGVESQIKGVIKTQMLLEPTVAQSPAPTVELIQDRANLIVNIDYTYEPTNEVFTLSFTVSE